MEKIKLPNIRKLFLPDLGKVIVDCDLAGADAQVVAWEANDRELKDAFRNGLNVHNMNGKAVWGEAYDPNKMVTKVMSMRDQMKRATHGTNYGASARTLAITLGWKIVTAEQFQATWFRLHPGILEWHKKVHYDLQTTRTVHNKFGYRIVYFDRPDGLLPEALAWIPQSTIGINCARGAVQLARIPWVDVLLQVHDSVVFQIPFHKLDRRGLEEIRKALTIVTPYDDPLIVPWEVKVSERSWGDVAKIKWEQYNEADIPCQSIQSTAEREGFRQIHPLPTGS